MAIRWDNLTVKSQEAMQAAGGLARENGNPEVLPVLERVGVPVEQMLSGVNAAVGKLPKVSGGGQPGVSAQLQRVLEQAFKEASNFKDEYVSTEHMLLALAEEKNGTVATPG